MPLLVGLNGFGRIGRIILRTCFVRSNIEIVAINDPVIDIEYICYLIKFDSTHGKFNNEISHSGDKIIINGKNIKVFHEKFPSSIPWNTLDVEYVVEASGMFSNMDKASGHLISASVKCVLVTTPSVDIPMLILGVNEHLIKKDQRVVSCASSTLYCLAPIVKVLEDNFGISEGFVTSVHAMTSSLKPVDGLCLKGRHWRDHRSAHQNIIPATSGAPKALGKIIPSVNDKFCGLSFRVPIVNVSVLDITVRLKKSTSIREIAAQIEKEGTGTMTNIITTSYDEAVSSDFMNHDHSCIFDVNTSLQLTPTSFKLICWYENEYSYANRVIDTLFFLQERFKSREPTKSFVPKKLRSESACETVKNQHAIKKFKSTKIFETVSLKDYLNKKIPNAPPLYTTDRRSNQEELHDEKTVKIIVYDDKSNTNNAQGINIQSSIIIDNRERLELAKKELAKITSKTEDLLRETNHDKAKEKSNGSKLEPSSSNNKITYTDDNNDKTSVESNKEESNTDSIVNVNHIDYFLNILSEIKTHNVEEAFTDIGEQLDATNKNAFENTNIEEEIVDVEQKNQNISLHNFEASIIISDRDGRENTIVSITGKQNINNNNKLLSRRSHSHEHLNYDKFESKISENDIVPLEFKNKKLLTKNNKNNIIDKVNENKERLANQNSNILLMSSGSLDSKKVLKLDDINLKFQIGEHRDIKNQMIMKNILSSVLKSSKSDISPMLDSFKLINNEECLAKENLLDKLDSETDSEYSFRIDETKSQVIDITDLLSSTDDLASLDKICRIIEISDELSDELFSALNNGVSGKKEWSFKEFCEKIKLDDFCRKIFGQSV